MMTLGAAILIAVFVFYVLPGLFYGMTLVDDGMELDEVTVRAVFWPRWAVPFTIKTVISGGTK